MAIVFKCRSCRLTIVNRKADRCPRCGQAGYSGPLLDLHRGRDNFTSQELSVVLGNSEDFTHDQRLDIVAVTSLSPRKHSVDRQRECIESWKRFGLQVFVRNTAEEIKTLRPLFHGITWIIDDDVCQGYAYPTQKILNLARTAIDLQRPVLVINSDCEIRGPSDWLAFDEQTQFIAVRWDFEPETQHEPVESRWGLDAFTFTPKQAALLPDDFPFGIGRPVWDYAVPAVMQNHGISLSIPHRPFLFHKSHEVNWSQDDWKSGQRWLRYRLGIQIEWGDGHFRQKMEPDWQYSKTRWVPKCKP